MKPEKLTEEQKLQMAQEKADRDAKNRERAKSFALWGRINGFVAHHRIIEEDVRFAELAVTLGLMRKVERNSIVGYISI